MIGLPYGEKNYDNTLSRFHTIQERNGQTDGRMDRFAISIWRVSMCAIKMVHMTHSILLLLILILGRFSYRALAGELLNFSQFTY